MDTILEEDGANVPRRIPGTKAPGPIEKVPTDESRRRRIVLSRLLATGKPDDEIFQIMGLTRMPDGTPGFGMSPNGVRKLISEVYATWGEEDSSRKPHLKSAARRRIYKHMEKAISDSQWSAVSNFEKTLARIEGTEEPLETHNTIDINITEAALLVLGEADPVAVRQLIESERALLGDGGHGEIIDVEAEEVKPARDDDDEPADSDT